MSKDPSVRLAELGFDPIKRMIALYDEICDELLELKSGERVSGQTLTQLLLIKQKIINDLLRYGYARVTEALELPVTNVQPVVINLTQDYKALEEASRKDDSIEDIEYDDLDEDKVDKLNQKYVGVSEAMSDSEELSDSSVGSVDPDDTPIRRYRDLDEDVK